MVDKNWCITKYGVLGMTYFEFLIGAMVCKNAWLEKIKYCITDKMKKWQKITVAFVIIIGLLIGHTLIVPSLFIAPFTGGIVILIFSIWEKTELIKNTFHIPKADEILNSASVRDALEAFSDWLDMNPDCWDENGYDYSDLGRQAQKVYDDILYDNVYANKSNA